jgi:hypothetical protein
VRALCEVLVTGEPEEPALEPEEVEPLVPEPLE